MTGCLRGSEDVASVTFLVNNGMVSPPYYAETSIVLVPDYDSRTLSVNYSVLYPYRSEETDAGDVATDGVVGGEFFDQFENVLNILAAPSMKNFEPVSDDEDIVGAGSFVVRLFGSEEKIGEFDFTGADVSQDVDGYGVVRAFYDDLVLLFSQEIY
ncbi:MAG: hypothetical protein ABIH78_02545 [Candidatus Peregrinibacteria bacterium]